MEEPSSNIEKFDIINPPPQNQQNQHNQQNQNPPEEKEGQKRRCSYFPSAYTILICLEFIVFILTYIIPKGKFDTIEYDSDSNRFIISIYNRTATPETKFEEAKQEVLDKYGVKIDLVKFTSGDIKRAISIPGSYKKLEDEENANFFDLFTYPILGLINASNVGFVLIIKDIYLI